MIYMNSFKGYNLNREELCIMFREKSVSGLEKSRPLPAYCAAYVPDCYCIDLCNALWPLQKNNQHRQRKPGLIFFFPQLYCQLLNSTWNIFVFSVRFSCCWEPVVMAWPSAEWLKQSCWGPYGRHFMSFPTSGCRLQPAEMFLHHLKYFFSCMLLSVFINTFYWESASLSSEHCKSGCLSQLNWY